MFRKILVANRGEIACRVITAARNMGVRTVAVYSDADRDARHVALADEARRIGPAEARESYLSMEAVLAAARETGADAIHPGYGFLSENEDFAAACAKAGIVFIGPTPQAIAARGDKSAATRLMEKAGVPLVPGYHGENQDPVFLRKEADKIGYPVLIKASAGGGGKGMRTVAVYSDADRDARHVSLADEARRIGPPEARASYLNTEAILSAARESGAEAIHPGYGFLSENEAFAAACAKAGIVFIGPSPEAIAAMGDKSAAKRLMEKAGVPLVPGYHGENQDPAFLQKEADKIGYPVLIKASAGGGGKGMRVVQEAKAFAAARIPAPRRNPWHPRQCACPCRRRPRRP